MEPRPGREVPEARLRVPVQDPRSLDHLHRGTVDDLVPQHGDLAAGPVVALSTAHPAKFPEAVEAALGFAPERPPQLEGLEGRTEVFETVDPNLEAVIAAIG